MRRAVSRHGLRSTDLPREPARHRSLSLGASRPSFTTWASGRRSRSTLADANENARLAHLRRIRPAPDRTGPDALRRRSLGVDLENTAYALDSTTIDLCLSVFPWAPFRTTKAAVKMHTLLDLRGNIPSFIHISDGKLHDVNVLDVLLPEAGCDLRHGSRLPRLRAASCAASGERLLRDPRQVEHPDAHASIRPRSIETRASSAIRPSLSPALLQPQGLSRRICAASASRIPRPARRWCS